MTYNAGSRQTTNATRPTRGGLFRGGLGDEVRMNSKSRYRSVPLHRRWVNDEWGSEVILASLFKVFGAAAFNIVAIVTGSLCLVCTTLYARALGARGGRLASIAILLSFGAISVTASFGFGAVSSTARAVLRPQSETSSSLPRPLQCTPMRARRLVR